MEKTISLLNNISLECHGNISYYQDNRSVSFNNSYRYICGRIDGSVWLNNLIEIFLRKNSIILKEIIDNIISKKMTLLDTTSDYNQGLYEQLDEMEKKIDVRINSL